ncbi:Uncharacterised protein [Vibrio cholerae]|nr:Uncharacterised protein [Vibrio cholerae]
MLSSHNLPSRAHASCWRMGPISIGRKITASTISRVNTAYRFIGIICTNAEIALISVISCAAKMPPMRAMM